MIGLSSLPEYLRFTWLTSRLITVEPADFYERVGPNQPCIIAMWHGQHFMTPFIRREHRVKVLISRHRDGEINAYAADRLGVIPVAADRGDHAAAATDGLKAIWRGGVPEVRC